MQILLLGPDNQYPRYIGDLEEQYPGFDLSVEELPEGWFLVTEVEPPAVAPKEIAFEVPPVLIEGSYYQTWQTRELTDEEVELRSKKFLPFGLEITP
jgi:hypothetical protein